MSSTRQKIMSRVRGKGRGNVFVPKDFVDFGARTGIDKALSRLAASGDIRRLDRGLYDLPRVHPSLGALGADPYALAQALGRRTGDVVVLSGASAANKLGLSTQVPMRSVFGTSGKTRSFSIGRQSLTLRHVPAIDLLFPNTKAGMAISALRYIGQANIDQSMVDHLARILPAADLRRLTKAQAKMPTWLAQILAQVTHESARPTH
jgi:hypothetical protein